ncbi:hypothetical protein AJ80_09837 [Polytolypa hystricis UAMH7299]|uniref:DUF1740-domain-containing protein n=1 Tax=Polytolypa hystricis (strain UAMH7299) TaxID=1447883 RepID=A0A2B7WIE8_POLH7|nr:hypothetical protein AJ80_09837 [Polytolypa hystricis UAMH7299]
MDPGELKEKKPIPKFASFNPKPAAKPEAPREHETRAERRTERSSSRRERPRHNHRHSKHRDSSRSRRRSREQDSHSTHSRIKDQAPELRTTTPLTRLHTLSISRDDTDLFEVDTKGDSYNLTYGSLHKYNIPSYYRYGRGRVLGLPPYCRIEHNFVDGTALAIRSTAGGIDGKKQNNRELLARSTKKDKTVYRVRQDPQNNPAVDSQKDFLPLSTGGSRKRKRTYYEEESSRESTPSDDYRVPDYRSIDVRSKPSEAAPDDDLYLEPGLELDDETARQRNADLSRRVVEHPEDLDAWFELINHQDALVGTADTDGRRRLTSAEKRSVADIRISMCEKALKKLSTNTPRDRLLLRMMEEGASIWDTRTISDKWKSILHRNPGFIRLWVKYLDFQQTLFVNFTYDQCRSIFLDCLKINRSRPDSPEHDVINLYLLLRLSLFLREAGFLEQAVGLWQALLEFNLFQPEGIDVAGNIDTALAAFAEFWESEAPRIGEGGAKGWNNTDNIAMGERSDASGLSIDSRSVFKSWETSERHQMISSRLPARTLDDVQEDDPFRVILFSDIQDFLVPFTKPSMTEMLIDTFLLFCRLPPIAPYGKSDVPTQWRGDPFICNLPLDQLDSNFSQWFSDLHAASDDSSRSSPTVFPLHNFATSSDTLFGNGDEWFSVLQVWKSTYIDSTGQLDPEWIQLTLRQLTDRLPGYDQLAEYTVALEQARSPAEVKKLARSLLKKRPSSLRLYNAYALIQSRAGEVSAAERVWATTLSMSQNFAEDDRIDRVLLWRSWLWEELGKQNLKRATILLRAIPSSTVNPDTLMSDASTNPSLSPADILKSRQSLVEIQQHALACRKPDVFVSATECIALLFYIARDLDIEHAVDMYKTAASRISAHKLDNTIFSELLHQAKAKLLYHHATSTRLYKPSFLRDQLAESISLFPYNTLILSIFAWNESRFRIDDRVRTVMRQHTSPTFRHQAADDKGITAKFSTHASNLIPHFFSIYTELHRGVSSGSTAHSARSAFENAVTTAPSSGPGQSCAGLWKLYVLFELTIGQDDERARDVFYRAIRACPWAKELVMLAFRERGLRKRMGQEELRKVWNVLVEKELRVHVDLEEWFEDEEGRMEVEGEGKRGLPFSLPEDKSSGDEGAV